MIKYQDRYSIQAFSPLNPPGVLCTFSTFNIVQNAVGPTYKHYLLLLKSAEITVFWSCFGQLRQFCANKYVKMAKWPLLC